jgi:protein AATF/BFR2
MEGEAYRGKKSSRAAVFGDDEQVDDDGDDALDGQLSGDHLLGSDDQCDDSEEQGGGEWQAVAGRRGVSDGRQ